MSQLASQRDSFVQLGKKSKTLPGALCAVWETAESICVSFMTPKVVLPNMGSAYSLLSSWEFLKNSKHPWKRGTVQVFPGDREKWEQTRRDSPRWLHLRRELPHAEPFACQGGALTLSCVEGALGWGEPFPVYPPSPRGNQRFNASEFRCSVWVSWFFKAVHRLLIHKFVQLSKWVNFYK